VLAHILHELDTEFDPSHLESSQGASKYLTNKRNIQAVYKGLFRFIRRQVPELGCQAKKFDYHAVAENPDAQGISQVGLGPPTQMCGHITFDTCSHTHFLSAIAPRSHGFGSRHGA